jgi:hypothetical protein
MLDVDMVDVESDYSILNIINLHTFFIQKSWLRPGQALKGLKGRAS